MNQMEGNNNEEDVNQTGSLEITSYNGSYKNNHLNVDDIKNFLKTL